MASSFSTRVVGLSFIKSYPANIFRLNELAGEGDDMVPVPAYLLRNPDNTFDANAIEVHVTALKEMAFIGHIPAAVAKRLAPHLDAGEEWVAVITKVAIHPDHPENPGIDITIDRVTEGEPW